MKQKLAPFDIINHIILLLLAVSALYPFWHILVISVSTDQAYFNSWYHVIPTSFTLEPYLYNFKQPQLVRSFGISVFITCLGTLITVLTTSMAAYFFSKSNLRLRKPIFFLFIVTMFFEGGLIPLYVLVTDIGLRNTLWALFLPTMINMFNLIICKNYFLELPKDIEESAKIDGANDIIIFYKIIFPISKPIIATISLFYAVQFWNDWFNGLLYLTNNKLSPLALHLRSILATAITMDVASVVDVNAPATIRGAAIIITLLPIVAVYPFIQKYFIKGIMLGSTKG